LEGTEKVLIHRIEAGAVETTGDTLVVEKNVAIELGGEELIHTTCSPGRMREWVLGYLCSEGWIDQAEDVAEIRETNGLHSVELADSAPTGPVPVSRVASNLTIGIERLLEAARNVARRGEVFAATGGTHTMGIIGPTGVASIAEDISRTCALEKAIGAALLEGVAFEESFAFLSSRVPSRMIAKLARCGVPIVAAVSAPTIDAVRLAEKLNVCLCGFVRNERGNVYAHGWRVGL